MNAVLFTAVGVGGATILGSIFGFIFINQTERVCNIILSFAAGVMLATSIFNLIIPSLDNGNLNSLFYTVSGIFSGACCISLLDFIVKKFLVSVEKNKKNSINRRDRLQKILIFVVAIAVHNLPEGIAAGVGFGTGNTVDALTIAGSIALQNIPEGMVIIAPMLSVGISRSKTLLIAILTGVIEISGTIIGYYSVTFSNRILPFALSFAGGTMIYVICSDMIPETQNTIKKRSSSYALIFGFCVMIILDNIINRF